MMSRGKDSGHAAPRIVACVGSYRIRIDGGRGHDRDSRGEENLARELPRIKPLQPGDMLRSFRIHRAFWLKPEAVEPLVTDSVSLSTTPTGGPSSLMRGYHNPEKVPSG